MKLEIIAPKARINGEAIEIGSIVTFGGDKLPPSLIGKVREVSASEKGITLHEGRDFIVNPDFDRDALKAKADALGIEYPKNIPTEKLAAAVAEKEA